MARRQKLSMAERGRLGGKATLERYGREHFVRLGKAGFQGLARRLGYAGMSRLGALRMLIGKGKIRLSAKELREQREAEAWADEFLEQFFETCA